MSVRGYLGVMAVDGVLNCGGNPTAPRAYIYDMENFESIALYKEAVTGDLESGLGNKGRAIEIRPKVAKIEPFIDLSKSIGEYAYKRTYIRGNSGNTDLFVTRLSLAILYNEVDKWEGSGDLGTRHNFHLTLVQPLGETFEIKGLGNFNEMGSYKYRNLTYQKAIDINTYRKLNFNETLTGDPAKDKYYYKYNWEKHINRDGFMLIPAILLETVRVSIKSYISREDVEIKDSVAGGSTDARVEQRIRDIERKGVISEIGTETPMARLTLGYHFEASDMNISSQNYGLTQGGGLVYQGYGATTGTTYIHSHIPYGKLAGTIDRLNWQAGLKYFTFKDASNGGFVSDKNNPYLLITPDLDREERTYDVLLPTSGVSYDLSEGLEAYSSYRKNFILPYAYMSLVNLYSNTRSTFQKAGITLDDLFQGYDIEESDNVDVGLGFRKGFVEISPTFFYSYFYSWHRNLLTTAYDPRVNLTYQQNIGKASGYGLEVGAGLYFSAYITFVLNSTYTNLRYKEDITYAGKILDNEWKQLGDTPRWMLVSGILLKYNDFKVSPIMRYLGKRYGDAEHKGKIPLYALFDVRFSYNKDTRNIGNLSLKNVKIAFEVGNLFDKQCISVINAMDDALMGFTTYSVGAPNNILHGSVSIAF